MTSQETTPRSTKMRLLLAGVSGAVAGLVRAVANKVLDHLFD